MQENTSRGPAILIGLIVVVILFFALCFRVVGVGKVGIVTRLGNVDREVQSGVMLKLPWPLETLSRFDVRTQKDQADAAAASKESQDVKSTVVTNYHIEPGKVGELFRTVGTEYKIRLIDPAIQEAVKQNTVLFPASDILSNRAELKNATLRSLREKLAPRGIQVEDISYTNIEFSKEFHAAIEAKAAAQQQAQQAQFNLERARIDAQAQEVQRASLTPEILQKMAIDKWKGDMPQALGSNTLFNIPLGK